MDATASPLAPILGLVAVILLTALIAGAIELGRHLITNPIDVADLIDRARWWLAQWDPAVYLREDGYAEARRRSADERRALARSLAAGWLTRDEVRLNVLGRDDLTIELDTTPLLREQDYGARFYAHRFTPRPEPEITEADASGLVIRYTDPDNYITLLRSETFGTTPGRRGIEDGDR